MPFAEILGHDRIIEVLRRSLRGGKTAHSYLFEGVQGCGRKKTALALIQALFCTTLPDDACGVCPSCRKIDGGNHPDIHFISPLPDKRDISIEQLREMQHELALRPYEAPRKACIIDPAERMSVSAANSLLKTLEEPPGNALIILLTENAGMLLSTVRSRCQLIRFAPLSPEHVLSLLEESGMAPEAAALVAPMAGGSLKRALELDNEALAARRDAVLSRISQLNVNRIATVFDAAEELSGNRDATLELLDMLLSFFRDAVHLGAGNGEIVNRSVRPAIESIATRRSLPRNLELLESIYETRRSVQRNANPKLALDHLFMVMGDGGR
ncbi:MAG: DNA polymerase III subunit delta' [Desulfuromonadaceae bacterium]|nr:DNA polymerase III subunit delta' [Desulfuromonadaceae bacterium]MDD2847003.1 DNA polymerase III subunit delta' [Desulfuromonadaceae bacterium]MDD4129019.1 DNA polymerase III subunit delta' [Desulfuromonadaceae bacterium]